MSHYIEKCVHCETVISQCRCPSKDKKVEWGVCEKCAAAPPTPDWTLDKIGTKSVLNHGDAKWLSQLSQLLHEEGFYTKAIYLQKMVDNAKREQTDYTKLAARRFAGNGDVLCDIGRGGCPFVNIVDNRSGYCQLYNMQLDYVDTGNNELCDRCDECRRDK